MSTDVGIFHVQRHPLFKSCLPVRDGMGKSGPMNPLRMISFKKPVTGAYLHGVDSRDPGLAVKMQTLQTLPQK